MKLLFLNKTELLLFILIFIACLIFSSCSEHRLSIPQYIEYVRTPENGLLNSVIRNGYKFSLQYEPADYVTIKELRNEKITQKLYSETHKKFCDYFYFDFIISPQTESAKVLDKADTTTYDKRYQYFAFDLSKDIVLISNKDTLPCLMHQFAGDNHVSPEYHFALMFDFPKEKFLSEDTLQLIYNDELLNTGKVSVPIFTKKITNLPQLKI